MTDRDKPETVPAFKIHDRVDVIDRRDGVVIERGVYVLSLHEETWPDRGTRTIAGLSCGYGVSTRCLRRAEA